MIHFLTLSEILIILEDQIRNYGGMYGVRDLNLLSSAIYIPQSGFGGEYFHKTIPAMAAAYAFHICQNHLFIDGNKRVALTSSLVFLDINGYTFNCKEEMVYEKIMNVAKGELNKEGLIKYYEKYSKKK
ncbi:MAG: type II toxin-antitoxin system death-on-curing family toxin [Treponema sp.]|jgi:death-on-curing protein|nr:type II toxin-antitoxin system death-on-curing family toxin [Treponema sp.]